MTGFLCGTCGQQHDELPMCFGFPAPQLWLSLPESERQTRAELSSDQCVIDGKYFFVLGRIEIPVIGTCDSFVWLAWVSLSEKSFLRSCELWEASGREKEPPFFGWLQSSLPSYPETLNLKVSVQTMPVGERPLITLEPLDHPLCHEQIGGMHVSRVREVAKACLHRV